MTAQLLPNVYQQFLGITGDYTGEPLAGGLLYSYAAGTSTPLATYTDETAGTPNSNPIVLNSLGAANIWLGPSAYKFVLQDANNVVQWTVDNVSYINPNSIDLTKISGDIAGLALLQNDSGALDVQVDEVTIEINESNDLQVKPGGLTSSAFGAASLLEVVVKKVRDYSCPGLIQQIPQYEWSNPSLLSNPVVIPSGAATVTKWSPNGEFLAVGYNTTPYLTIYQMSDGVLTALQAPLTMPNNIVNDLSWSPCGDFLAVAYKGTPCIIIYQRFGNSFIALPTPNSVPTGSGKVGQHILFSPNSDFLILGWSGNAGSEGCIIYERSTPNNVSTTDSGTAAGSISVPVTGTANLDSGAVTGTAAGSISISESGTGTGTMISCIFTDITTSSTLTGITGPFSWYPDSSLLAAQDTSTGNVDVFNREDYVFTGITPPDLGAYVGNQTGFAFSPDGNFLAVSLNITPFVLIFQIESDTFIQLSNPGILPPGTASYIAWSENSEYLLVGDSSGTSPYMTIYQVTNPTSSPTFTAIAAPSTVPAGSVSSADFSSTKQFLAVASATTPYLQVYETASVLPANGILWSREAPNV